MEMKTAISEGLAKRLVPFEELKEKILRRRMKYEERRELMERLAKMKAEAETYYLEYEENMRRYQEELERIKRDEETLAAKRKLLEKARKEAARKKEEAERSKKCMPEGCDESHLLPALPVLQEPGDSTCLVSVPGGPGALRGRSQIT